MQITRDELTALADILENPLHTLQLSNALYALLEDGLTKIDIEKYDLEIELTE